MKISHSRLPWPGACACGEKLCEVQAGRGQDKPRIPNGVVSIKVPRIQGGAGRGASFFMTAANPSQCAHTCRAQPGSRAPRRHPCPKYRDYLTALALLGSWT